MTVNSMAEEAKPQPAVIAGFLSISRLYLGVAPPTSDRPTSMLAPTGLIRNRRPLRCQVAGVNTSNGTSALREAMGVLND